MLPFHPLKLRWISDYYRFIQSKIVKTMSSEGLKLSVSNSNFFFKKMGGLSSFQVPPYMVLEKKTANVVRMFASPLSNLHGFAHYDGSCAEYRTKL